jgi:hypothetical protein
MPLWQRAQVHLSRGSLAAAASLAVMLARAGILQGSQTTRNLSDSLAQARCDLIDQAYEDRLPPRI